MPQAIHISPIDNVVVALHPIAKGTLVEVDGLSVTALEDIPQGHITLSRLYSLILTALSTFNSPMRRTALTMRR